MSKLKVLVDRLRAGEPAWLADKRKAIIGPVVGAVTVALAKWGVNLTALEAELIGLAVTSAVTWAIPNQAPR